MSEGADRSGHPGVAGSQQAGAAARSAGAMLRHIRESAGIDAAVVARALKITPQMLQALEQDRYQALPDLSFARSLAASICRNFGVDPEPVLAQMPRVHAADLPTPERGINAPFHGAGDRPMPLLPKYIARPLTLVVALFLLGSLLLWLWPTLPIRLGDANPDEQVVSTEAQFGAEVDKGQRAETPAAAAAPLPQPDAALAEADEQAEVDAAEEAAVTDGGTAGAQAGQEHVEAPAEPEPADGRAGGDGAVDDPATATHASPAPAPAPDAAPAPAPGADVDHADEAATEQGAATSAASDDLVIEASGESWVSVRDATGKALFNRLLGAGETARISGAKPLSATIGRKDAVTVRVHGEPFDHRSLSNSSVSRFKID